MDQCLEIKSKSHDASTQAGKHHGSDTQSATCAVAHSKRSRQQRAHSPEQTYSYCNPYIAATNRKVVEEGTRVPEDMAVPQSHCAKLESWCT